MKVNGPVLGFRTWDVAKPSRRRVPGTGGRSFRSFSSSMRGTVSTPLTPASPELQQWLEARLGKPPGPAPKTSLRFETAQPEMEIGTLFSLTRFGLSEEGESVWAKPGRVRFSCKRHHPRPNRNCECGLYAYFALDQAAQHSDGDVVGAVVATGHLVLHGVQGFRAEWLRIVALSVPPPQTQDAKPKAGLWAKKAAERLGVHFVAYDRLEQVGREFGTPITWEYRFDG